MSVDDASELFKGLRQKLSITNNIEITLEANPGTFDANKFAQFRELGITVCRLVCSHLIIKT